MPYVKRKINEEPLVPNWLRKLFGPRAQAPATPVAVAMPKAVIIPISAGTRPMPAPVYPPFKKGKLIVFPGPGKKGG